MYIENFIQRNDLDIKRLIQDINNKLFLEKPEKYMHASIYRPTKGQAKKSAGWMPWH